LLSLITVPDSFKELLMQLIDMVRKNPFSKYRFWLVLVLIIIAVWSCNGRPARKKLPDLAGDPAFWESTMTIVDRHPEKIPGLPPFYASDTTLLLGGRTSDLLTISLPDRTYDSVAVQLVTAWSPMARTLLDQLAARGEKGVLIDLRISLSRQDHFGDRSTAYQVESQVSAGARLSLPVVFCWDRASAARAAAIINRLRGIAGFRYTPIDGDKDDRPNDPGCFSADSPTNFDRQ
jgi:hypothetical protein